MAKSFGFTVLCVYLTLQLIAAFPYQNSLNGVEDEDSKLIGLEHSKAVKLAEDDFRKSLQPVLVSTLDILEEHSKTLILESASFLDDLLVELNTLPEDNEYVKQLIPELTNLLDRLEKLDLDDESTPALEEKAAVLLAIAKVYGNFDLIARSSDDSGEQAVVKKAFDKLESKGLNERINKSSKRAVDKFNTVFAPFWNSLSDVQKGEHADLADWYERYQAIESSQEKLKSFIEFLNIIHDIVIPKIN
ncbi:uncharacterized protein LOC126751994 [Bactrocera neohumeralis]|uniref:uncharacterized protein LOC120769408 n=1 Tax=Bactrocera tryoni TaxID=59916 RepID=UPI001A95E1B0|nr:uncharacterized protein LOC120769408 [Bactrocera tryoni]XP_050318470.1 uncharacterized protein LOC126751994 [Bactrocera neohumeralis]